MSRHQISNLYIIGVTGEESKINYKKKKIEENFSVPSKGENSDLFSAKMNTTPPQKGAKFKKILGEKVLI